MTDVLARIPSLTEGELRGWWWCVMVERIRPEYEGERAALIKQAKALKMGPQSLPQNSLGAINEAGREGATNTNPALDITNLNRGSEHARKHG